MEQQSPYTIREESTIPPSTWRKGPRSSIALEVLAEIEAAETKIVSMGFDTDEEAGRLYKSLIQYRRRHSLEDALGIQKSGLRIYAWSIRAAGRRPAPAAEPAPRLHQHTVIPPIPRKRRRPRLR